MALQQLRWGRRRASPDLGAEVLAVEARCLRSAPDHIGLAARAHAGHTLLGFCLEVPSRSPANPAAPIRASQHTPGHFWL